jgi:hypothetical protein
LKEGKVSGVKLVYRVDGKAWRTSKVMKVFTHDTSESTRLDRFLIGDR